MTDIAGDMSPFKTGAEFPLGTVTAVTTTQLTVNVRGVNIPAAYLRTYTNPAVGDLVALGRENATWLVLGPLAGVGGNSILNPSFEAEGLTWAVPAFWNGFALSGTPSVSVQATGFAVDGTYELVVSSGAGAHDTYVYSSPIAVTTGQQWAVSAYATASYPPAAVQDADIALEGLWFANATNTYPTTSAADTLIAQVNNIIGAPTHTAVSGTVTVPAATSFMRIAVRTIANANISVMWDLVTARRVG